MLTRIEPSLASQETEKIRLAHETKEFLDPIVPCGILTSKATTSLMQGWPTGEGTLQGGSSSSSEVKVHQRYTIMND